MSLSNSRERRLNPRELKVEMTSQKYPLSDMYKRLPIRQPFLFCNLLKFFM